MLGKYKLSVDTFSEILELLNYPHNWPLPIVDSSFFDFTSAAINKDTIYVVGRNQVNNNVEKIKYILDNDLAKIVYSNPSEGSETLVYQTRHIGLEQYILDGKMFAIGGGDMEDRYTHLNYDHFLPKVYDYPHNITQCRRTEEIYRKLNKPYKFLFLNGRNRPHRRWLQHFFKDHNILDQSLWTNLDSHTGFFKELPYVVDGRDKLRDPVPVKSLPHEYEVEKYHKNLNKEFSDTFIKYELFQHEGKLDWGDVLLQAEPYIDTYFSLITETVFVYPYSFRTEKIWKPIAIGHPWIAVANQGFYKDLRNLGFKTFDGIIDESFDNESNNLKRIEHVAHLVKDLCSDNQKLENFLLASKEICLYNKQHLAKLRHEVRSRFRQNFIDAIVKWTT
jgi:hypothetical protein